MTNMAASVGGNLRQLTVDRTLSAGQDCVPSVKWDEHTGDVLPRRESFLSNFVRTQHEKGLQDGATR